MAFMQLYLSFQDCPMHPSIARRLAMPAESARPAQREASFPTPALRPAEARELLALLPENRLDLYALARLAFSAGGAAPFTCGIINAKSGRCSEDCAFCAQSAHHGAEAPVYGLVEADALLRRAEALAERGARYMGIVISGAAPSGRDFDALCEAPGSILPRVPIKLCASFGLLTAEQAVRLKQAGFTSYHHNLESSREWYGRVCATHAFERRLETVRNAAAAGLRVCSGGIFGLGESWEDRLALAATLAELGVDSIPVNFLTPIKGTPLERQPKLSPAEALDCLALMRLMHPGRDIIVCGGRAAVLGDWDKALYFAGANAMMIGDYLTTKGGGADADRELLTVLGVGA
jgi:biotin synthase